jgi:hypothetical protein
VSRFDISFSTLIFQQQRVNKPTKNSNYTSFIVIHLLNLFKVQFCFVALSP